jgi:hypothetical protein
MQAVVNATERFYGKLKKNFSREETSVLKALNSVYNNLDDGSLEGITGSDMLLLDFRAIQQTITVAP